MCCRHLWKTLQALSSGQVKFWYARDVPHCLQSILYILRRPQWGICGKTLSDMVDGGVQEKLSRFAGSFGDTCNLLTEPHQKMLWPSSFWECAQLSLEATSASCSLRLTKCLQQEVIPIHAQRPEHSMSGPKNSWRLHLRSTSHVYVLWQTFPGIKRSQNPCPMLRLLTWGLQASKGQAQYL